MYTASHQLATRTYMDFLRMEAEINFLAFLPREQRMPLYRHWYRGTHYPEKMASVAVTRNFGKAPTGLTPGIVRRIRFMPACSIWVDTRIVSAMLCMQCCMVNEKFERQGM
jgi:hypothetical protein